METPQVVLPCPTVHHPPAPLLPLPLPLVRPFPSLHSAFNLFVFLLFIFSFFLLTMSLSRYLGPPLLCWQMRGWVVPSFFMHAHRALLPLTDARRMLVCFSFLSPFHLLTASPSCSPIHHVTLCHALPCHIVPSPCITLSCHAFAMHTLLHRTFATCRPSCHTFAMCHPSCCAFTTRHLLCRAFVAQCSVWTWVEVEEIG